jgi:hypothetical protein
VDLLGPPPVSTKVDGEILKTGNGLHDQVKYQNRDIPGNVMCQKDRNALQPSILLASYSSLGYVFKRRARNNTIDGRSA